MTQATTTLTRAVWHGVYLTLTVLIAIFFVLIIIMFIALMMFVSIAVCRCPWRWICVGIAALPYRHHVAEKNKQQTRLMKRSIELLSSSLHSAVL